MLHEFWDMFYIHLTLLRDQDNDNDIIDYEQSDKTTRTTNISIKRGMTLQLPSSQIDDKNDDHTFMTRPKERRRRRRKK